ncbi:head maturation protease, ClpP-related [Candidatus Williamhamiltonella defendens]|uniref:ATP-dependent Clp protease proteolytic subunit n=1 Tax=Candidatus Hamiltonella defensa (Bemisia tabaci) TaxID=672795 RepID=A0A249DXM4_9ENTR|nr:head maturation protease, ClpP-related [Candidatus Hamiltonella defensa]ASX26015.1 peptidase S14 [Candidatus Hamiltonella defensa (Bemisia tabaci)]
MKKKALPVLPAVFPCPTMTSEILPSALARWNSRIRASSQDENTLSIFESIGQDWAGEGVTAQRMGAILRSLEGKAVTVNINSPGGDLFEGLTIYNQLREYPGKVTVKILGLAASAASIIAMSGDEIQIGRSAFLMIHNTWGMAVGHRHDFADMAEKMAPFDLAMREIYVARTGMDETTITGMMDRETWMNGGEAIEKGFADALLPADSTQQDNDSPIAALRKLEALLAKANTPRAERRRLLNALRGDMPGDIPPSHGTPRAAHEVSSETWTQLDNALRRLVSIPS